MAVCFFSTVVGTRMTSIVKARQKYVFIGVISAHPLHQRQTGLHWGRVRGRWGLQGSCKCQYKVPLWACPALQQVPSGPLSFTSVFPGTHTVRAILSRIMPGGKPRYHLHSPGNDAFTARLKQWGPMKHRVCSPALKSLVLLGVLTTEFLLWYCFVQRSEWWQKVW